ncbi:PE family protein [Minicystis rosea]|nr:PE family protein [Minicystis rosea]
MATRTFNAFFATDAVVALAVLAFREEHRLGRPSSVTVTCQLAEPIDPEAVIGTAAKFSFIAGEEGTPHDFMGIVAAVTLVGSTDMGNQSVHHVRFHVVSPMALLEHNFGSQIFQELDVKEVVSRVLEQNGIARNVLEWKTDATYPKREYCVQYNESALDFVSRLLEEEGIYYASEARDDGEHLVFRDDSTRAPTIDGGAKLPFRRRMGLEIGGDAVYSITEQRRVVSGKFVLRDYDFKRPKLNMTVEAEADADIDLEVYDFPGHYVEPKEGERLATVRLEAEQAERSTIHIQADCTRLVCGRKIEIVDALHDEINGEYVITSLVHHLGHGGGAAATYGAEATLVPAKVKFRSPRITPVPIIEGPQTAMVVAPKGADAEEIHTDEHGRCKVKFPWDLGPAQDDKASCWMRVGQLQTSGSVILPRIGWEVIVEFLEGNPDRPMVTGRLYNGISMPPYQLPEGKTRTAMLTYSTPGGGGANEIRLEDKAGSEEIRIQAQYDESITVANNKTKNVGNNETRTVAVDSTTDVGANQDVKITKGAQSAISGNQSTSVGGNRSVEVNAVTALNVGGSSSTSVGGNHFEMDGNPLKALLALAAQKAAEVAQAMADQALAKIDAAVQSKVDQVLGPVNAVQAQMQQIGAGMQAVANGDLGAAAPLLSQAAGLPSPGGFAGALGGGGGDGAGGGGGEAARADGGGGEAARAGGEGGGEGGGGITSQLGLDQAVHGAISQGISAGADALGAALGLDGDGGGGESEANEAGPAGDVGGVDATDRAKGPGHSTSKIAGTAKESIGSVRVAAALTGVNLNVSGNVNESIGAARLEMALGNRAEEVGGSKTETSLGLVIITKGDETETVGAAKTAMVGGAILEKIGGAHNIVAGAPATFIGAFHKIEAGTAITLKCGASEVVIDGSGIALTSPIVTITAGKVSMTKAVSEM